MGKPADEVINIIAYKLRCMLLHMRIKYDCGTTCAAFDNMFQMMQKPCGENSKRSRRLERLQSRPCPFVNYRQGEKEEEEQEEEQPRIISKYMDGTRAVALYCDGSRAFADAYSPGRNGFAMAHWLADHACMEAELPNRLCDGGQLAFPKAATRVQKKPSAVEVVCLDEKDEEEDSDPCDSGPA